MIWGYNNQLINVIGECEMETAWHVMPKLNPLGTKIYAIRFFGVGAGEDPCQLPVMEQVLEMMIWDWKWHYVRMTPQFLVIFYCTVLQQTNHSYVGMWLDSIVNMGFHDLCRNILLPAQWGCDFEW